VAKRSETRAGLTVAQWTEKVYGAKADLFDRAFLTEVEKLYIISKKVFSGKLKAERRTKKLGSGVEFAEHRDYTPGDDFRYIDWNIYGRLNRLLLRLFEEEEDLHIYILVDLSESMTMGDPPKFFYALKIAAALAHIGLSNLDRVAVIPFADGIVDRLPPNRGKGRIFKIFEFLRQQRPGNKTDLTKTLKSFVAQNKRRGLAVLLSDFYDPAGYQEAINVLAYNHYETFVIQVYDRKEVEPNLMGDLELVDVETGDIRHVTVSPGLLRRYAQEHAAFRRKLADFCTASAMPFFQVHTQVPFADLVLDIFRRGGFVK